MKSIILGKKRKRKTQRAQNPRGFVYSDIISKFPSIPSPLNGKKTKKIKRDQNINVVVGRCLTVLGPLVLAADLLLLLGGEVVGDVEGLADLLGRLALNHVGDSLAADVEEGLDVEVVGRLGIPC